MTTPDYSYEYDHANETVQLGVHCSGDAHEPMVCWQIGDQNGECGYVRSDTPNPVVNLEESETAFIDGQAVSEIPVPEEIAKELNAAVEKLGAVVADSNRIADDSTAFPSKIDGFERTGWDSERSVMWYWLDKRTAPRAYQIERGELIFRAQEWADSPRSKNELIQSHDLENI